MLWDSCVGKNRKGGKPVNLDREKLRLYAVTDRECLIPGKTLPEAVEEVLQAGVKCIQLREKQGDMDQIRKEAYRVKELCDRFGALFIINDYPQLALEVGASGVHVGQEDMEIEKAREILGDSFLIGGSAHNVAEALKAQEAGADYIGCGAVFGSATKLDAGVLPLTELERICDSVSIPVVAIGGINKNNIGRLSGIKIAGAAVVNALFGAEDPGREARNLMEQIKA